MTYTHVIYVALLEQRLPQRATIFDPDDLTHDNLFKIGLLPSTLDHLVYGYDLYQMSYVLNVYCDYQINFVYPDGLEHLFEHRVEIFGNRPIVFLLCTNDKNTIINYCIQLSRYSLSDVCFLVGEEQKEAFLLPNTFSQIDKVLSFLYNQAEKLIHINSAMSPNVVPIFARDLDTGILFKPSRVNTMTSQRVVGNWGFPYDDFTAEDYEKTSMAAHENPDSTHRQDQLVNQIAKLNAIEQMAWDQMKSAVGATDFHLQAQLRAPLILCAPFTNADIRKAYTDEINDPVFKQIQEAINMVLSHEYTLNYVVRPEKEVPNELIPHLAMAANLLINRRCQFLDLMAVLHG